MASLRVAAPALLVLGLAPAAHAERRAFAVTRDVDLQTEGVTELDWTSTHVLDAGWAGELEIVHGLGARWDVALLQHVAAPPAEVTVVGERTPDPGLTLGAFGSRVRYAPTDRGTWPVDLRGELSALKSPASCRVTLAPRAVFARDLWRLRLVANAGADVALDFGELERDCGHGAALEVSTTATWAAGVRARPWSSVDLGVEAFGDVADVGSGDRVGRAWVGPTASWARSSRLWATLGLGVVVAGAADDLVARVGFGLAL
ncbi:MAG: hypothetical protein R2939_20210 [Kofleriaceae bacterium]